MGNNPSKRWLQLAALASSLQLFACTNDRAEQSKPADSVMLNPSATRTDSPTHPMPWRLRATGLGPLRAGMSVAEVRNVLPDLSSPDDIATSECTYARARSLPSGATLMFSHGALVRIDVISGKVRTEQGAAIGFTEEQVKSLYGKTVETSPHKYTEGHYLTVRPDNPADSSFRIVFETDGIGVIRFRSGLRPAVEYVEGCG